MIVIKKDCQGIGSNFLRLLDWLWYAKYSKDEIHIDWTINGVDLLSNVLNYKNPEKQSNSKFYDHFVGKFNHELNEKAIEARRRDVPFYDKYGMKFIGVKNGYFYTTPEVYFEKNFILLRKILNEALNSRFSLRDSLINSLFNKTVKTLGVHIRSPQHYCSGCHGGPTAISNAQQFYDDCAKFVYKKFCSEKFDKIYVACDINDFYTSLNGFFSNEQIIKINYERLTGDVDWGSGNRSLIDITHNTFLDIFNLSRCDKILCGVSNLTLTSLVINKDLEFEFYPFLRSIHGQ